jgi:hypothetical protein
MCDFLLLTSAFSIGHNVHYPPATGGKSAITSPSSREVSSRPRNSTFLPFLRILTKSRGIPGAANNKSLKPSYRPVSSPRRERMVAPFGRSTRICASITSRKVANDLTVTVMRFSVSVISVRFHLGIFLVISLKGFWIAPMFTTKPRTVGPAGYTSPSSLRFSGVGVPSLSQPRRV